MPDLNVTMVAFHGNAKPKPLEKLLQDVLGAITANLPPSLTWAFKSYSFAQIHATIIGMEVDVVDGRFYSRWFRKNRGQEQLIDIDRLREKVKQDIRDNRLFTIRFGGFPEAYCKCKDDPQARETWSCASSPSGFHSCDRSTYEGSFYAFSPGPLVITGWPVCGPRELETFPHRLYEFRQSVEEAGFLDKYHSDEKPHWKDDDCFMRVGTFSGVLPYEQLRATEKAVRDYLSNRKPVAVDVTVDDVSILLYDDPSLEEGHVKQCVPLANFLEDPSAVKRLYGTLL